MCLLGSNGADSDGHGAAPWALTGRGHGRVSRTRKEKKRNNRKGGERRHKSPAPSCSCCGVFARATE